MIIDREAGSPVRWAGEGGFRTRAAAFDDYKENIRRLPEWFTEAVEFAEIPDCPDDGSPGYWYWSVTIEDDLEVVPGFYWDGVFDGPLPPYEHD